MSKQHPLFPITLSGMWQAPSYAKQRNEISSTLLNWLLDSGSLTTRLSANCQQFRVELLGQKIQACPDVEANGTIKAGEQVLVREVLLYCDEQPQVFARSLLPLSSLTGEEQKLADLGTQSLGQVLFNNPSLQRQNIEIAHFAVDSSVGLLAEKLALPKQAQLWGRRSIFVLEDKPLMVAEVFLPNAFAYREDT